MININKYSSLRFFVFLLSFILLRISLFAQHDVTLYYMDYVPQSYYTNPALVPKPKFHIALPVISHTNVKLYHNGFTFSDIINKRLDDSLIITLDHAIDQLADVNYLSFDNNIDLISVSFKIDDVFYLGKSSLCLPRMYQQNHEHRVTRRNISLCKRMHRIRL